MFLSISNCIAFSIVAIAINMSNYIYHPSICYLSINMYYQNIEWSVEPYFSLCHFTLLIYNGLNYFLCIFENHIRWWFHFCFNCQNIILKIKRRRMHGISQDFFSYHVLPAWCSKMPSFIISFMFRELSLVILKGRPGDRFY